MRAIVFDGRGGVELRDVAAPPVGPGQVRLRTRLTGVSAGTETFTLRTNRDGVALIPGYQSVGLVAALGPGTHGLRVGDRVYTHHRRGVELPPDAALGPVRLGSGAHASERLGPADSADLIPLPDWIPDLPAAFLSVAAIGLHAARRGGLRSGARVLVMGLGPVGLHAVQHAVQGARLLGASVHGLDRVPFRLAKAHEVGCETTFDARRETVWEEVAGHGAHGGRLAQGAKGGTAGAVERPVMLTHAHAHGHLLGRDQGVPARPQGQPQPQPAGRAPAATKD